MTAPRPPALPMPACGHKFCAPFVCRFENVVPQDDRSLAQTAAGLADASNRSPLSPAGTAPDFDFKATLDRANQAYFASQGIAIPASIKPTECERLIGRKIAARDDPAQRRYDEREMKRAFNRMGEK